MTPCFNSWQAGPLACKTAVRRRLGSGHPMSSESADRGLELCERVLADYFPAWSAAKPCTLLSFSAGGPDPRGSGPPA